MVTSCDPINSYTTTATFGVPYNGGYKPDPTLEWLPPNDNTVDERDDFIPPPILPPSNMLMKTCEGRRIDPRMFGTYPSPLYEYDDLTTVKEDYKLDEFPTKKDITKTFDEWNIIILLIVVLAAILLVSKFR